MATISQKEWNRYIAMLRNINEKAEKEFADWVVDNLGYAHIERQKLIDHAYAIAAKYGEASSALSAEMYDAIAELSGAVVPSAVPVEVKYPDVAKTVNGIIKKTGSEDILVQGVGRLVKMAGTDTILSNAYRDRGKGSKRKHSGAQVAWIPSGDTCPYCLMLASKGWQRQTQWGANNHSEHIHANCDCTYAVRFDDRFNVEGYDPDKLREDYYDAGDNQKDRLNAMRREQYAQNPEKYREQKREAYERRKNTLFTTDDPMRDVLGAAEKSNPDRLSDIMAELTDKGVNVIRRPGAMGYQPSPVPGKPGQIVMEPDASISAWEHEYKHCKDDEDLGWAGIRVFSDVDMAEKFERDAYAVEVELAEKLGYNDIVEKLRKLEEKRVKDVRKGK